MILSRFELSLECAEARRDIANPYEMHRTLCRLVDGGRNLWRQEGRGVLMLSDNSPKWESVEAEYFATQPSSRAYPVDKMKLDGRRLSFRLLANPTKSIKEGLRREQRGKRVPLIREEEQLAWLARQGERWGFSVVTAEVSRSGELRFQKKKGQRPVVVGTCLFEGVLVVTDAELFREVLAGGIGRAKAFGLGLLSVAAG